MATIMLPVKALDEKCVQCKCLRLGKNEFYAGMDKVFTEYYCENLHLCTFIRNRIVRNEEKGEESNADSN